MLSGSYFLLTNSLESYLEHFESAGQRGRFGIPQSEEEVEKSFPVVLLEHDLLAVLRRLRRRRRCLSLLPRVLDQALTAPNESLRLFKMGHILNYKSLESVSFPTPAFNTCKISGDTLVATLIVHFYK